MVFYPYILANGVKAALAKWVASQNTFDSHIGSFDCAIMANRIVHILGTRGREPAGRRQNWRDEFFVHPQKPHDHQSSSRRSHFKNLLTARSNSFVSAVYFN